MDSVIKRRGLLRAATIGAVACSTRTAWPHPDHVSIAEADYRPERRCLELSLRCKPEDLEAICSQRMRVRVMFGRPGFGAVAANYLREVLQLRGPNGEVLAPLTWVGGELERRYAWIYLVLPTVAPGQKEELVPGLAGYEIQNRLFFSFVHGQINSMVLRRGLRSQSFHFHAARPSARIEA